MDRQRMEKINKAEYTASQVACGWKETVTIGDSFTGGSAPDLAYVNIFNLKVFSS